MPSSLHTPLVVRGWLCESSLLHGLMMKFSIKNLLVFFIVRFTPQAAANQLTSSSDGSACPNDPVAFTCSVSRTSLRWTVSPPPDYLVSEQVTQIITSSEFTSGSIFVGVKGFMFRIDVTNTSHGNLTSTLTTITEVSMLNGSVVSCTGSMTESLTIDVAEPPSSPSTPMVASQQHVVSSCNINLEWDPPSSTGGVSVRYVLTIAPIPLSGSPVTVETSAQITVSYNTPYNVTIRAVNCAGSSSDVMTMIPSIVTCPSDPPPADRVTINIAVPLPALVGSTLIFTCNGETVPATCERGGQWSPDPTTYDCPSVITCGTPVVPSRGSVDVSGGTPPFLQGSQVTYRCDVDFFPAGDMLSTCENVGGVGTWKPDTNITCRDMPVNCTIPEEPSNVTIVDYNRLNETVLEGTVLTYQCDNGFSLTGPNTITCTNAGVWSTELEAIVCVSSTEAATLSTGVTLAIGVTTTFLASTILGFLAGLLVMYSFTRKKAVYYTRKTTLSAVEPTKPVSPVYEEVSPKEEIELNTNQAYGPLGL